MLSNIFKVRKGGKEGRRKGGMDRGRINTNIQQLDSTILKVCSQYIFIVYSQ